MVTVNNQAGLSALAAALRKLPENETAVIVLTYYDRMTDAQIAACMGITPERVVELRRRAEETLKQQGVA